MREGFRFDDVGACFAFFDALVVVSKLAELQGDGPSFREEVILLREVFAHAHKSQPKQVLPGQDVDTWEVVDLLMEIHAEQGIGLYLSISPPHVPIPTSLTLLDYPAQLLRNFLNNRVLSV